LKRAAIAAAVVLSGSRTIAEPCAPSARLDGDGDLAARVSAQLGQLGIATTAAPGCPSLRAAVARDASGRVTVTIRDGADRIEGRVVADAILAAVWIDSWLRDDVAAPLWSPRTLPASEAPGAPAPVEAVHDDVPRAAPSLFDRVAIGAGYAQAWSDESGGWSGFSADACVRVGRLCVGARARMLGQDLASSAGMAAVRRGDVEALASASIAIELGRMHVAPELGVGVGRFATDRVDGCKPPPNCAPADPACKLPIPTPGCDPGTPRVGDNFSAATWTPRAAATVRVAVPLFDHVWLDGTIAGELAPGGAGPYTATSDPAVGPAPTIPAEPGAWLAIGVGLRVGAP